MKKALNFVVELGRHLRVNSPMEPDVSVLAAIEQSNLYQSLTAEEVAAANWLVWHELYVRRGIDPSRTSTRVATASFGLRHIRAGFEGKESA